MNRSRSVCTSAWRLPSSRSRFKILDSLMPNPSDPVSHNTSLSVGPASTSAFDANSRLRRMAGTFSSQRVRHTLTMLAVCPPFMSGTHPRMLAPSRSSRIALSRQRHQARAEAQLAARRRLLHFGNGWRVGEEEQDAHPAVAIMAVRAVPHLAAEAEEVLAQAVQGVGVQAREHLADAGPRLAQPFGVPDAEDGVAPPQRLAGTRRALRLQQPPAHHLRRQAREEPSQGRFGIVADRPPRHAVEVVHRRGLRSVCGHFARSPATRAGEP
ncbi:MAG: hypothetical protein K2W96_13135 [Gemmataceae bacterium]|nr:hypothetical protein [Gemmataceae bacterium]